MSLAQAAQAVNVTVDLDEDADDDDDGPAAGCVPSAQANVTAATAGSPVQAGIAYLRCAALVTHAVGKPLGIGPIVSLHRHV